MRKKIRSPVLLFVVLVTLLSGSLISRSIGAKQAHSGFTSDQPEAKVMQLFEFSHFNKDIYANYSIISFSVIIEHNDVNASDNYAYYSNDGINWESKELVRTFTLSAFRAVYSVDIGPFATVGEYYLKINSTYGVSVELGSLHLQFTVIDIPGIIFTNFLYNVEVTNENQQYANITIDVLGKDIKIGSIKVASDQQEEEMPPVSLSSKGGSNYTYTVYLGPIDSWATNSPLTFMANTSTNVMYTNDNYVLQKGSLNYPEDFWTQKFPAILVAVAVVATLTTVFFMKNRKAPKDFKLDVGKKRRKDKKKEKKEKKEE